MSGYETVIGLEVHCQLATETKIFCGCPARVAASLMEAETAPNFNTCPVCAGHPGTLPVLNARALEYAIKAGLATGCRINPRTVFARKNYFYPDLPKGYQISQLDLPLCSDGAIVLESGKRVSIERIHMEEDAGKSTHHSGYSLVNLNRAGTPLVEIVSRPELASALEAGDYLRKLHAIVVGAEICDGNMQNGNFRCDANVSVRKPGQALGTRVEIKNVNSFRFVEKAIYHEVARQINALEAGLRIVQETRLYDSDQDKTISMRSKEDAQDYRYFPDPDLIPFQIPSDWVERIKATLPELPAQRKARFISEHGLSEYDAQVLIDSPALTWFFEETLKLAPGQAKPIANFVSGELARRAKEGAADATDGGDAGSVGSTDLRRAKVTPAHLARVVQLVQSHEISSTGAKTVLAQAWKTGDGVDAIVEREGLKQVSDTAALEALVGQIVAENAAQTAELKAGFETGQTKLLGFFVGQVMKRSGGKANPQLLQEIIRKKVQSS